MASQHRVLVVGVGSIGERHVRCFQTTGRADVSICEVNAELAQQVARRYGVSRNYADLNDALAEPHDAAVIATPAHLHIPMAWQAAEAGLGLLIEKPLSVELADATEFCAHAQQADVLAAVAYVLRAHPALASMKRAIDSGRFGRPLQLVAVSGQNFPTYRPAYREIYYRDHATGGGAIQDALTHSINAGQWLVGPIDRLFADAAHLALPGVEVEDTVHLMARQGDALSSYSLNQHQAPNESTITVICERGVARFEYHRSRWRWMALPGENWHDENIEPLERDTLFVAQANAFLDTLEGRHPPLCDLSEALQTLRVNLAALQSAARPAWTRLD